MSSRLDHMNSPSMTASHTTSILLASALVITPSHQQNTHDFTDGRKNMNYIFDNYVRSASHMCPGRHFQNV